MLPLNKQVRDVRKIEAGHVPAAPLRRTGPQAGKLIPQQRPHPPKPPKKPKRKKYTEKEKFIWAEGQQESGGDYLAVNSSSGALGRWQVMPANLPGWLKESGQQPMSDYDYLHSHKAQDRLAWVILGGDFDKWGPRSAASIWYSGQPNWRATYGDPPVYQYVDDVIALMNQAGAGIPPPPGDQQPIGPQPKPPPPTKADDWSEQVAATATRFKRAGATATLHANFIRSISGLG